MKYTIALLVENQSGVLSKVAGLFSRRGYNIESLAVGMTDDSSVSRMTVVVDCAPEHIEQIEKQLNKLIQVIKVKVFEEGTYLERELTLVKLTCNSKQRTELMKIAELMNAKIIDVTPTTMTLEFTDNAERTQTFIDLLKPYGIRELVCTGVSAVEKGTVVLRKTV